MPLKGVDLNKYADGSQILWDAFSSATKDLALAKQFVKSKNDGIIFKIKTYHGKDISPYSMVAAESEVLLDPRLRYVVARSAYIEEDYKFIDLIEVTSDLFQF